ALCHLTSIYSLKILILLNTKPYTQAQLSNIFNLQKQNTSKYIKELLSINLIEVDRIEGKNKFFKPITPLKI
ncbi:MAG TPA: hypothetical protein VIK86_00385, partial [Candidatus Paceibacterota bacterium]